MIQSILFMLDKVDMRFIGGSNPYTFLDVSDFLFVEWGAKFVPDNMAEAKEEKEDINLPVDLTIFSKFGDDGEVTKILLWFMGLVLRVQKLAQLPALNLIYSPKRFAAFLIQNMGKVFAGPYRCTSGSMGPEVDPHVHVVRRCPSRGYGHLAAGADVDLHAQAVRQGGSLQDYGQGHR